MPDEGEGVNPVPFQRQRTTVRIEGSAWASAPDQASTLVFSIPAEMENVENGTKIGAKP